VTDTDGTVPHGEGAVDSLEDLLTYDPSLDQNLFSTHNRAVPGQACARCHLWSRGKGYRGAVGRDGVYRADGCAACQMIYSNDGYSASADASIDHAEQGHPLVHTITKKVTNEQCTHCHHRGARIGLSFSGRSQMPPRLPSGAGVPGTTAVIFNGNNHYVDPETDPEDIHHSLGLDCIDCHTRAGVMGDGNIYGHMDQATKIQCESCHGLPDAPATTLDEDGNQLTNVQTELDGRVLLTGKVSGSVHEVPQVQDLVDSGAPEYNPQAATAMGPDHIKADGGLACYACHTSWVPNCFGCHFERDERFTGMNLLAGDTEVGRARTNNKMFVALRHFSMGKNPRREVLALYRGLSPDRGSHRTRRHDDPGLRDA